MKNVVAIAAGVVESLGLGHNAMAALITRGLVEVSRLATAMGGRPDTLAGLSGLGDLVLTCTGHRSRNRQVGVELGRGRSLEDVLRGQRMVAEGVRTAQAALELGARHGVELPITQQMQAVIEGVRTPQGGARRVDAAAAEERSRRSPRLMRGAARRTSTGADMRRFGTILAERLLAEQASGKVVRVSLGVPRAGTDDADWECPFRISGAGISRVEFGRGIDSMQALTTALDFIRVLLDESGLALGWKMGAGREDIWHEETGFARSIPIALGACDHQTHSSAWSTVRSSRKSSVWSAGRNRRRSRPLGVPGRRRSRGRAGRPADIIGAWVFFLA